jgi:hypothetical protein
MKDLIIDSLKDSLDILEKRTPKNKKVVKSISIMDVNPVDLKDFMSKNNIPNTAYFDGRDNGYDAWDDILLSWEVETPTTKKEQLIYKRRVFSDIAFKLIYNTLINNGYKRVGVCSSKFKEFDDTTIYDMYVNKDYDRLVKYYTLYFVKNY